MSQRVVVVDDEIMVGRALARILQSMGCYVVCFIDPREALAYFDDARNDAEVVFSDTNMPRMWGLEFLRRLLALRPHAYRVIMSGLDQGEAKEAVTSGVAHRFMSKPWDNTQIVACLDAARAHGASQAG